MTMYFCILSNDMKHVHHTHVPRYSYSTISSIASLFVPSLGKRT
jgi:hypothetical protein